MSHGSTNPDFKPTDGQQRQLDMVGTDATHCMAYGGSRSSKTFGWCYILVLRALAYESRHLILRRHYKDARQAIGMETFPEMMDIVFPGIEYDVNHTDWYITITAKRKDKKKGHSSVIWLGGLDDGKRMDKVLGREYSTIFFNEASELLSYEAITTVHSRLAQKSGLRIKCLYDQNPPSKAHWTYKLFERKEMPGTRDQTLEYPGDYTSTLMNPDENQGNLADGYIDRILAAMPEKQRRRFQFGLYADEVEDALWKASTIDHYRINPDQLPELAYVVIPIDPAVKSNKKSNETGIVPIGKGVDGHYYVLEDATMSGHPSEWGTKAIELFNKYQANVIVGEVNNGGDLIENNIRNCHGGAHIPYEMVHATRGKIRRAEPVATLYVQGMVHHVGTHRYLEDQMTTYNPLIVLDQEESPDRMDACLPGWVTITTDYGRIPIHAAKVGMKTLTRNGFKEIINAGCTGMADSLVHIKTECGRELWCTRNHPVLVQEHGWVDAANITTGMKLYSEDGQWKPSCSAGLSTPGTLTANREHTADTSLRPENQEGQHTTETCGHLFTVNHPRGLLSTTRMATGIITRLTTWCASLARNMQRFTRRRGLTSSGKWPRLGVSMRKHGTHPAKAEHGIAKIAENNGKAKSLPSRKRVNHAEASSWRTMREPSIALGGVSIGRQTNDGTRSSQSGVAPSVVSHSSQGYAGRLARVVAVQHIGVKRMPVYNIEVADYPEYVANGILVHNCVWGITKAANLSPGAFTLGSLMSNAVGEYEDE